MEAYPDYWPKPDPNKPNKLQSRITEQQKLDLYNRVITTRALAAQLGVHERYFSAMFPHKVPILDKKPLTEARKAYKLQVAREVLAGKYTVAEASKVAHVHKNTMQRYVLKARKLQQEAAKC